MPCNMYNTFEYREDDYVYEIASQRIEKPCRPEVSCS